ncbi:MAG: pilus assembly protein [Geminicoccaceae bacterium]|jgi:Flp pilus assembly protein TadG|nr:pilus assembly protein [Geminicoccaceae bacterium]
MKPLLNRLIGDERGGAIAEFMLGLVPLVIAFALVFEFGRAFWSHQAAIKGVRDATRYLTRVEDPNDAGAQAIAQNLLLTGQQAPGGTARWSSGSAPAMEVDLTDPTAPIPIVTVTANVELQLPLSNVFALFGGSALGVVTYAVSDSARHYGQ